jgi:uncharacterized protein
MSPIPIPDAISRTRARSRAAATLLVLAAAAPARAQAPHPAPPTLPPSACAATPVTAPSTAPLPLATFAYDRATPLVLRDSLERTADGVTVRRLSFASPKGGRATGFLVVPTDAPRGAGGRLAGVVLLHGAPGSASQMLGLAAPIARHGAVVLALDAPFARRDPNDPLTFTPRDSADQVQLVVDLQRAVDVLAARPDVDATRLGFVGGSYGGAIGALLAGVERRLRAYSLELADGGLAAHFTAEDGRRLAPPGPIPVARWCRWLDALEPIAPLRFVGRAAPAALLFQWGRHDPLVPAYRADALWRAAPEPKERRWYDAGHGLPPEAWADRMAWLAAHLGLTPLAPGEGAPTRGAAR